MLACKSEKELQLPFVSHPLAGKWRWVHTTGGFSGAGTNPYPQANGRPVEVEFRADGRYLEYINGQEVVNTTFKLMEDVSIFDGQKREYVSYENGKPGQIIYLSGDSLQLRENCYDCYQWIYIKAAKE